VIAPDANGWMPIETAPKDGTAILVAGTNRNGAPMLGEAYWHVNPDGRDDVGFWWANTDPGDYYACQIDEGALTHWQPLPKPPVAS